MDVQKIKEDFCKVITHSQDIANPIVDDLFTDWANNKARFIDLFDGPIYEWENEIEFQLDDETKRMKVTFLADKIEYAWNNKALANFLMDNVDGFYNNIVVNNEKFDFIPKGMKLVKAFKFFESDKERLDALQTLASMCVQESKVKGKLCFSVHPLDFLSSSENTHNWRSCHALDGDYRAGNLSYMADSVTFIAYLKSSDGDMRLPAFPVDVPWNSKKWRMLIHIDKTDTAMFAGRQYPFEAPGALNKILLILNTLLMDKNLGNFSEWNNACISELSFPDGSRTHLRHRYLSYYGELYPIDGYIKRGKNSLNYNDLLASSSYLNPYYAYKWKGWCSQRSLENLLENHLVIGKSCNCLQCGKDVITSTDSMRCYDCELNYGNAINDDWGFCSCCGQRIYYENAYYIDETGEYVCGECYNSECAYCENCQESFWKSSMIYDEEKGQYLCKSCMEVVS